MNGVVNLYKPSGITSSDAVVKLKRIFHMGRVGHFGTLDPLGEGVLLVGVGMAARLFDYFSSSPKEYYACFKFGETTDTLDSAGQVTGSCEVVPTAEQVRTALTAFEGRISQMPPAYSAKSVGGVRAYQLARQGVEPALTPKDVTIYSAKVTEQLSEDTFGFNFLVSGGTYIRSLARDIASALGTVGYMTKIVRTKYGEFDIKNSLSIERVSEIKENALILTQNAINLPEIELNQNFLKQVSNGVAINVKNPDGKYKVFCAGEFFGIGQVEREMLKLKVRLKE